MEIVFDNAFLTEFINILNTKFPRSSNLGMVVLFMGASLDFVATKCTETFPDCETDLI